MSHFDIDHDDILLLLRLGDEAGGRVDPARLRARGAGSTSRRAFEAATALGYLDSDGWITDEGAVALGCMACFELNHSDSRSERSKRADREGMFGARLRVHPDVAERFVAQAIKDGATVPNPPELDGAFRLALQWAYARMGGEARNF